MSTKHQVAASAAAPPDYLEAIRTNVSRRRDQMTIHPATYRLVYDLDQ